jgi:hypothetical protein
MYTSWCILSMLYQHTAKRYMAEEVLLDIRNVCDSSIILQGYTDSLQWLPQLKLDNSDREKGALFVKDLRVLQHGLWVRDTEVFPHERLRVQESPLNIGTAGTATRPAALVRKKPLLYRHIEFQLFPPPREGLPPLVVLVLNLKHIKRSGGRKKP